MRFKHYNANPLNRMVNDCSVRAISLATGTTWYQTFEKLSHFAKEKGITFSEVEFINDYLAERYTQYKPKENSKVKTLGDFLDLELPGRWLITMAGHITCVIDGVCYDTFDPSDRYIWNAYYVSD